LKRLDSIKGYIISSDRYIQEKQLREAEKQNELKMQELQQRQAQQWHENMYGKPVQKHHVVVDVRL